MPKIREETQREHLELVRQALAMQPRASLVAIRDAIAQAKGFSLDPHYILKLRKKIEGERKMRYSQARVAARIAEMQEKAELAQSKLWPILYSKVASDKNKIAAATAIMRIEKELFEAQQDAGIFERKLGEVDVSHHMPPEMMEPILKAFRNYGIVLDAEVIDITPKKLDEPESITSDE